MLDQSSGTKKNHQFLKSHIFNCDMKSNKVRVLDRMRAPNANSVFRPHLCDDLENDHSNQLSAYSIFEQRSRCVRLVGCGWNSSAHAKKCANSGRQFIVANDRQQTLEKQGASPARAKGGSHREVRDRGREKTGDAKPAGKSEQKSQILQLS